MGDSTEVSSTKLDTLIQEVAAMKLLLQMTHDTVTELTAIITQVQSKVNYIHHDLDDVHDIVSGGDYDHSSSCSDSSSCCDDYYGSDNCV